MTHPVAASPAVRVRGLRKRFGYRETLRGVDLEIPRGGCFGLFGPNGAGKSTLLRILATQWTFTSGVVEVLGTDVRRDPRLVRRQTGLVPHGSFLRRELTIEENLRFACELYALRYDDELSRIDALLQRFALSHRRKDRVATFSQGMVKRANIILSLLHRPELWILDEPFSSLDKEGQEVLEKTIRTFSAGGEFSQAGGTVILVTHGEERGARLADDWIGLEDGVIAEGARPSKRGQSAEA